MPIHLAEAGPRSTVDRRVDSSLARVTCRKPVLLTEGQVLFFPGFSGLRSLLMNSGLRSLLMNDRLDISEIFLKGL